MDNEHGEMILLQQENYDNYVENKNSLHVWENYIFPIVEEARISDQRLIQLTLDVLNVSWRCAYEWDLIGISGAVVRNETGGFDVFLLNLHDLVAYVENIPEEEILHKFKLLVYRFLLSRTSDNKSQLSDEELDKLLSQYDGESSS